MNTIEATGLTKRYGDVLAVDRLTLAVPAGQVTAVLGPNGAGKTTLIEMLLGLRHPTGGRVSVFGGDPHDRSVRSRVGAMLQDTDAPESLTVAEMVDLVASYYPTRLPLPEVLERADLTELRGRRVTQLSGGQRQRLSFALAIAGDPDLLFLDEPTAALDVAARRTFWQHVAAFAALGKTILFSTHNLAEVDEFADRVVVIATGRVIADGTPQEVKQLVAGRTLSLVTDATDTELAALPGFRGVVPAPTNGAAADGVRKGAAAHGTAVGGATGAATPGAHRAVRVQVTTAEPALRALFAGGRLVADLTVTEPSLEEAFVHLTGVGRTAHHRSPSAAVPVEPTEPKLENVR